jgi:hypothetical protein
MSEQQRPRGQEFRYVDFELTPQGELSCRYALDGETFVERFDLAPHGAYDTAAARAAARLVWLLAGVSYYKTGAPARIVVEGGLSALERDFLHQLYVEGLAEFAWRSGLDISDVEVTGEERSVVPVPAATDPARPLIPFGGGIDSIVVVDETVRSFPDAALFVANTSDVLFAPIEDTAAVTGLPVLRARRHLDEKVLASRQRGYFNGHVPVTGVLSAVAVLTAVAHGRGQVVMSNEHSASEPTALRANGTLVNHQWSKGLDFERRFRALLAATVTGVDYYSALRPYSELWVAERFAGLTGYHPVFRSCNKAFYVDPESRLAQWCGECDKCCFIDLILAPYLSRDQLDAIFTGREPLEQPRLEGAFRDLLGEPGRTKPLECVGDEGECRRAVLLAAARPDRADNPVLATLVGYVEATGLPVPEVATLLHAQGEHFLPGAAS